MKIYVDLVFFVNFMYDLFLLMAVAFCLKEKVTLKRLLFGAFLGGISIFFLFLPLNQVHLFFLKILVSIFMILGTFSYRNKTLFFKHLACLYFASFFLGGILYFLNDTFSYEKQGLIFFHKDISINFICILLLGPVFFYLYLKKLRVEKKNLSLVHQIRFEAFGKTFQVEGYLDTGNRLRDPFKKRSVILLYEKGLQPKIEESILVPFETAKGKGLVRCNLPETLYVDEKEMKNYLVGFLEEKVNLDGRSCILPNQMREELE